MISVLLLDCAGGRTDSLQADLARVGIHSLGAVQSDELVRAAAQKAPDLIIVADADADPRILETIASLQAAAPRPVVMFAGAMDAEDMRRAVASGVHALVVNGYDRSRLRSLVHLAQARFEHEQSLRGQLDELGRRFDERKLVERAKAILMRATQMPEEEAFRMLRNASMRGNRRVGQVSRDVIAAAREAESVNRAGQLRMLSQRLVKLHALLAGDTDVRGTSAMLAQTVERTDDNLARLAETVSQATYGDLLRPIQDTWKELRRPIGRPPDSAGLTALDRHAETLLRLAEQLTASLELGENGASLHLVNLTGRQRMLSQRVAKLALIGALATGEAARDARDGIAATTAEFEASLRYLERIPLTTEQTRALLAAASRDWAVMLENIGRSDTQAGRLALAGASEALLESFDRLTALYERDMSLLGDPGFPPR